MKWNVYVGIIAEDKVSNSRIAKVYVKELLPYYSGTLEDKTAKEQFSYKDKDGNELKDEIRSSNVVIAEWMEIGSNRANPPDVCKGEQVLVFGMSDTDMFYWVSIGRDERLRKKEFLRFHISNTDTIPADKDDENTYFVELDTRYKKRIRVGTSKSDNERWAYMIEIDAKNGNNRISIRDDDGNYIILESAVPRIKLKNKNGSFIDINRDDISIMAPRDIYIRSGRQIVSKTKNISSIADEAIVSKATNIGAYSSNYVIKSATFGVDGSAKISGSVKVGTMVSSSYDIGPVGSMYPYVTVNVDAGSGTVNTPTPDNTLPAVARTSASSQELQQIVSILTSCLDAINGQIALPDYSALISLAAASSMDNNRGT